MVCLWTTACQLWGDRSPVFRSQPAGCRQTRLPSLEAFQSPPEASTLHDCSIQYGRDCRGLDPISISCRLQSTRSFIFLGRHYIHCHGSIQRGRATSLWPCLFSHSQTQACFYGSRCILDPSTPEAAGHADWQNSPYSHLESSTDGKRVAPISSPCRHARSSFRQ